jgi:transposase
MPYGVRSAEKLEQKLQAGLAGDEGSKDGTGVFGIAAAHGFARSPTGKHRGVLQ